MMIKIEYKVMEKETSENYEVSKLFGVPVLPKGLLEKLSADDYFVGQIKMEDLKDFATELPKKGMLYFFLNVKEYPYKAKVIYSDKDPIVVVDDFNDAFDYLGEPKALHLSFLEGEGDIEMFGDFVETAKEEYDLNGYIPLLSIDSLSSSDFPNLGAIDGFYYFAIKQEDLKALKFNKVKFIAYGS